MSPQRPPLSYTIRRLNVRLLTLLTCALALVAQTGCSQDSTASHGKPVLLLAASSTTEAIDELVQSFTKQHPDIEIQVSTGASNQLAQQIISGAPVDLFLSANEVWGDAVQDEGLVAQRISLLSNRLVVVGAPDTSQTEVDIAKLLDSVEHLALAGENVPAGIYAEQALRNLGLFEQLKDSGKLIRGANVRTTLAYVERGEADAGIVYTTDARVSTQTHLLMQLDATLYDPITYPLLLLNVGEQGEGARLFYEFLQSKTASEIMSRYGFDPLQSSTPPQLTGPDA